MISAEVVAIEQKEHLFVQSQSTLKDVCMYLGGSSKCSDPRFRYSGVLHFHAHRDIGTSALVHMVAEQTQHQPSPQTKEIGTSFLCSFLVVLQEKRVTLPCS